MGMGTYGCFAYVIDEQFVKDMAAKEFEKLLNTLAENDISLFEFMRAVAEGNDDLYGELSAMSGNSTITEKSVETIRKAWKELQEKFEFETGGLSLYVVCHDREDRGDEIDGEVWAVGGVMDYTPAGKKYKDKIVHKSWTVYG